MRVLSGLLLSVFAVTGPTACNDDNDKNTATLTVSTDDLVLGGEAGESETFTITTTAAWKAVPSGEGFTLDKTEGTGDATVRVTAAAGNWDGYVKQLGSIEIGIDEGARIEASANPFRHRIIIFGSSFTHGTSTGRPGMSYPMIMQRNTGLQFISLGVSGNSKLQQSFAQIIGDNACDAIVVDAFSNPGPEMIRERFLPFVAAIRKAHPAVPLIFLQTIYRERANFDLKERAREEEKRRAARTVFEEAAKVYDHIYFVDEPDLTGTDHITSLDGTHPDDLGYWRWANAIQPRIVKILKKYGIR